jgi:gamma-glutamyltranspeptidase/glutathione hydrolase
VSDNLPFTTRPVVMGTYGVVAAGHYAAAEIGMTMLERGGNAVDAAVAAGFALELLKPHETGLGGEAPMLIYRAGEAPGPNPVAISGAGTAPDAATEAWFQSAGIDAIPGDGLLAATVPSAFGAFVTALLHYGTMGLRETLGPAVEIACGGFPAYPQLRDELEPYKARFLEEWPGSAAIYVSGGELPPVGSLIRNPDWAATFTGAIDAEIRELGRGREAGLRAALDWFYKGPVADRLAEFSRSEEVLDATGRAHRGLLAPGDLAGFATRLEEPVSTSYRGLEVFKCGPWTQGPVFLQQLNLLEGYDLASLGHNSVHYLHTLAEVAKLAFADREQYYGDPLFSDVPLDRLLSKEYARDRRRLIDPERASGELRPGDPPDVDHQLRGGPGGPRHAGDTTHLDVIDRDGTMVAITPSGGWVQSSPVIPGLGFPLTTRAQQFSLQPGHPNAIAPGKRPRLTLTPSLVLKDGQPYMVFGTPGGDQQDQWTLQFFLNVVDFGMDLQAAADAPLVHSLAFPSSFYPHESFPRRLVVEDRLDPAVRLGLEGRGHEIEVVDGWSSGEVSGIRYSPTTGLIEGAASPRGMAAYVVGR